MTKKNKTEKTTNKTIALNKKSRHDYILEQKFEAGLMLEGWEVKSIRAGRVQLKESYIMIKREEIWLIGCHLSVLQTTSTHKPADPTRTRKLLLNRREIDKLRSAIETKGYTIVPTALYWKNNRVKIEIAIAKGKKQHDKRTSDKERQWERTKQRLAKTKL